MCVQYGVCIIVCLDCYMRESVVIVIVMYVHQKMTPTV